MDGKKKENEPPSSLQGHCSAAAPLLLEMRGWSGREIFSESTWLHPIDPNPFQYFLEDLKKIEQIWDEFKSAHPFLILSVTCEGALMCAELASA